MGKAFSCLTHDPVRLAVINVGNLRSAVTGWQQVMTSSTWSHGVPSPHPWRTYRLRGRGTGLAAVYQIAEDFGSADQPADLFVGARTANRLYFREECDTVGRVTLATDDGSAGFMGALATRWRPFG